GHTISRVSEMTETHGKSNCCSIPRGPAVDVRSPIKPTVPWSWPRHPGLRASQWGRFHGFPLKRENQKWGNLLPSETSDRSWVNEFKPGVGEKSHLSCWPTLSGSGQLIVTTASAQRVYLCRKCLIAEEFHGAEQNAESYSTASW